MPYVKIKVTREGGPDGLGPTAAEKRELIEGVTDLLEQVLHKNPATTFVVIDEVPLDNWGMDRKQVSDIRRSSRTR
ncbi:tautomerase family protein [Roseobacter sp. S98]|uniref:tautomerase family protein n=1 Tax=Roseobacter algicola (ex Choi et al. 2025) (nom. illeg.) TaxID=3092138 RepID=UPI0035C7720B